MLQLPAHLQNKQNPAFASALTGGLGSPMPPTISRKNNRFTLIGANGEPHGTIVPSLHLDVIVVGGNPEASKIFYEGAFDPNDATAPDCYSDNGTAPSSQAAKPQSDLCALCKQNEWGSKISNISGKKVQACQTYKKVSVVVLGDATGTVYLLSVPPASLKPWRGYVQHLGGQGVEVWQVITRLAFSNDELGVLTFNALDFITEAMVGPVTKIIESDEPRIVAGALDKPRQAALPAPLGGRQQIQTGEERREPVNDMASGTTDSQLHALQAAQNSQTQAAEPLKRTRRTKAEIEAAKAAELPPAGAGAPSDELAVLRAKLAALEAGQKTTAAPELTQAAAAPTSFGHRAGCAGRCRN